MERVSGVKYQPIKYDLGDRRYVRGLPCKRYEIRQANRRLRRTQHELLREEDTADDMVLVSVAWLD